MASFAAGLSLTAGAVAVSSEGGGAALQVISQGLGIAWMAILAWRVKPTWASALFLTAMAWVALYLAPSLIYLASPSTQPPDLSLVETTALINLSLYALLAGVIVSSRSGRPSRHAQPISVAPIRASTRKLALAAGVGIVGLLAVLFHGGGPGEYLGNLDKTAEVNRGAVYLVWLSLFIKFAAITAVADRWAAGQPAGRVRLILAFSSIAAIGLIGARGLILLGLLELSLAYVLIRGHISFRLLVPAVAILGLALVFGLGSVKRFQTYQTGHPGTDITLSQYLWEIAPDETLTAYANNYADSVALTGRAQSIVPRDAPYEYGLAFARLSVKPIPRAWRPEIRAAPAIQTAFYTEGGGALAVPLQAQAYLQFGWFGVGVVFLAVGILIARVDLWTVGERRSLRSVLVLTAGVSQVPVVLRGGVPDGVVFLLIEVIGFWVVVTATQSRAATKVV